MTPTDIQRIRRTVRMMDKLNPLKNVAEKRQDTRDLPAPVLEALEVSVRSKRKVDRRAAKLTDKNAKEAAKLTDKNAKEAAKAAAVNEKKEREELAALDRQAVYAARKEARRSGKPPVHEPRSKVYLKAVSATETQMTEVSYLYDFTNEPVPRTKKELKALVLKLADANNELRARLLENSLADPARAAGFLMAKAAQSADEIVEQASRDCDKMINETVDTLKRTLDAVCNDLTATIAQAGNIAVDTLRNLKVR